MESPLEEEVRKAARDIYNEKNENGVEVNNPEKSIVRKSLEDIEADLADIETGEDIDDDVLKKMELDAGVDEEEPDIDEDGDSKHLFRRRSRSEEDGLEATRPESEELKKMERYDYSLEEYVKDENSTGFLQKLKSAFGSSGPGMEIPKTNADLEKSEENSEEEKKDLGESDESLERENIEGRNDSSEENDGEDQDIEKEIESFEEKMVEKESEELGKINELEKRVEKLEMDNSIESVEEKIYELEEKVEENNPEVILDRVDEIHQILKKPENHLEDLVNQAVRKNVESNTDSIKQLKSILEDIEKKVEINEAEIERLGREQQNLKDDLKDLKTGLGRRDEDTEDLEMKIDGIWQGMDRELERMEQRTGQNRQDIQELITEFTNFTEFMKKQLDQ